jgi:hypothetical protein
VRARPWHRLDRGGPALVGGVLWDFDAGLRPGQEIEVGVGVLRDVGERVSSGPAGQEGERAARPASDGDAAVTSSRLVVEASSACSASRTVMSGYFIIWGRGLKPGIKPQVSWLNVEGLLPGSEMAVTCEGRIFGGRATVRRNCRSLRLPSPVDLSAF